MRRSPGLLVACVWNSRIKAGVPAILLLCCELRIVVGAGCEGIDTGNRTPSKTHGIRDQLLCDEEEERDAYPVIAVGLGLQVRNLPTIDERESVFTASVGLYPAHIFPLRNFSTVPEAENAMHR